MFDDADGYHNDSKDEFFYMFPEQLSRSFKNSNKIE